MTDKLSVLIPPFIFLVIYFDAPIFILRTCKHSTVDIWDLHIRINNHWNHNYSRSEEKNIRNHRWTMSSDISSASTPQHDFSTEEIPSVPTIFKDLRTLHLVLTSLSLVLPTFSAWLFFPWWFNPHRAAIFCFIAAVFHWEIATFQAYHPIDRELAGIGFVLVSANLYLVFFGHFLYSRYPCRITFSASRSLRWSSLVSFFFQ